MKHAAEYRILLAGCLLALGLGACRRSPSPSEVVVYTSVDDLFARPLCEQFTQATGIRVRLVPDTEETKSTGLLNRLIAEKDRPRADVFWSGDPVRAALLKSKGIAEPYRSPSAKDLPEAFSDLEGFWTGFSGRARVIIYNKDLVPEVQKPSSIFDLTSARFQGRACLANPLFGTTAVHMAALFAVLGEGRAKKFFRDLAAHKVAVLSSNGEVRRRVALGDFDIGLVDTDDAHVALLDGKHIGMVFPDQEGLGTLFIPNAAVLIRRGPHPEAGRRFIDYLLRAESEEALARSPAAQIPLRATVPLPQSMVPLSSLKALRVDYDRLAPLLEQLSRGFFKDWMDQISQ